jgi:hypothetical protein
MLGKEVKRESTVLSHFSNLQLIRAWAAFVQGTKVPHDGVKTRKRNSREEAERQLREALERQVADLQLQLASKDRDNGDLRSIIGRLAEELLPSWSIKATTLQDMGRVRPSLFTAEQLAAFAIGPPLFTFDDPTLDGDIHPT